MFELDTPVVCVDDKFPDGIHDIYNTLPRAGSVYRVRDIVPAQTFGMQETCGVLLHELRNRPNRHGIEPAFHCSRFREATREELEEVMVAAIEEFHQQP